MVDSICVPIIPLDVQHISARLMVVKAPSAEIARALAMLLWTKRVRTGTGPERDVTPLAPCHGPSKRAWSHAEAPRAWRAS
jgi:hypothetical protein